LAAYICHEFCLFRNNERERTTSTMHPICLFVLLLFEKDFLPRA
jgi:hypothetical protein